MTLLDYFTAVLESVPTAATLPSQTVYDAINRARRRLAGESDATLALWNFNLTPNTWNYPYSGLIVEGCAVVSVRKVWLYIGTTRYPLDRSTKKFDYFYTNFFSWPVKWWNHKNSVYYWPTPAQAYTTDWLCSKQPNTLYNIDDTDNEIPYQYFDAVASLACKYTAISDGNTNLAEYFEQEYQRTLGSLPRNTL